MNPLGVIVAVACVLVLLAIVGPRYAQRVLDEFFDDLARQDRKSVPVVPPPPVVLAMQERDAELERAWDLPTVQHPLERQPWGVSGRSRWS
jgi:hypothetical protein